jgi:capsid assembly protease
MSMMAQDSSLHEALRRISARDMLVIPATSGELVGKLVDFAKLNPEKAEQYEAKSRELLEMAYGYAPDDSDERKPFVYSDGVAVIPIHGTLINRFNGSWGYVTGYNYVRRMLNLALDDDDVELIVFDVDSPGGEAAGCFELSREIMASRRVKPSLAVVDSTAASGGMAIACCASQMYAIPSARIGSIGVYRMHVSYEGMFKDAGIEITFAAAGAHKVDGNPYQKLPKEVLDSWEKEAGRTWDDFIALVAEARDMEPDAVRATEAQIYRADDALALGLIDAVKTPTEAVSAFLAELADGEPSDDDEDGEVGMADAKPKSEVTSGLTAADLQQISNMITTGITTAVGGLQRAQAIKDHAASKGQVALGAKLAANAAISAEDAIGMIDDAAATVSAAAPKKPKRQQAAAADGDEEDDDAEADDEDGDETEGADDEEGDEAEDDGGEAAAAAARKQRIKAKKGGNKVKAKPKGDRVNHFEETMNRSDHPNVGGGSGKGKPTGDAAISASILADHNRMTGADWSGKSKH